MDRNENECCWRGSPMEEIYRGLNEWELNHLPPIVNRRNHTVLFELPLDANSTQPPKPHDGHAKWDSSHVRLPCSLQNEYIVGDQKHEQSPMKKKRWEIIQNALLRPILNSRDLEKAILSYNTKYAKCWKFHALHELFEEELDEAESTAFFAETLPEIIRLALRLPDLIPSAIPLLKHGTSNSVSLSQEQVGCLLANAFLCTFPRRNASNLNSEYRNFPSINFNWLFQSLVRQHPQVIEKIKCICFYFRRICKKMPHGTITFARRTKSVNKFPNWDECDAAFGDASMVHISSEGTIEDNGNGLLQVDFANKYIGGGVLNLGCVQEEIRFVIYTELLCSRLFTEQLDLNECILIMGCERFNSYSGYASTFKWTGGYEDTTPFDSSRRRKCCVVAIDAIYFKDQSHQYQEELMKRELNKAFVGFYHELSTPAAAVATGNWGCGAFNGDKSLKALLQLMVCCVTNRPMVYFTFGDAQLRDELYSIFEFLKMNKIKICTLWSYLKRFRRCKLAAEHLYPYIMQCHQDVGHALTQSVDRVTKTSTIIEKSISNVINSSTTAIVNRENPSAPWPLSDDEDEDLIAEQIETIEESLKTSKTHISDVINCRSSPSLAKRKQMKIEETERHPLQNLSSHIPVEIKEKRQRSLLDSLDQNYYVENPNKIKRETIGRGIGSTLTSALENLSHASDEHNTFANSNSKCCVNIDSASTTESTETNENIERLHIGEANNESIQCQVNELETLHVVSSPGSDSHSNADSLSPDAIPGTSQNSLLFEKYQRKACTSDTLSPDCISSTPKPVQACGYKDNTVDGEEATKNLQADLPTSAIKLVTPQPSKPCEIKSKPQRTLMDFFKTK